MITTRTASMTDPTCLIEMQISVRKEQSNDLQ